MKTLRGAARDFLRRMLPALVLGSIAVAASAQAVRVPERFRPPPSWADLVDAVSPAVVSIHATTTEGADAAADSTAGDARKKEAEPDPFAFFFDDSAPGGEQRTDIGGTGFLVSRDGLVVTNVHVIEGAQDIQVTHGGRTYAARVRGTDPMTDIALLQIDAGRDLPYLELADSDASRVGDWVMVIGNPLQLDKTVTTGVISAKGREIGVSDNAVLENFIQTDAAINFGNSGGPMVDMQGRAVGVTTAVNFGAENIGFAVPSNIVRDILPQLRETGRVRRGDLGLQLKPVRRDSASSSGDEGERVLRVEGLDAGRAAQQAGLKRGDLVVSIDGHAITTARELTYYVANKTPGTRVTLELLRDGEPLTKQVTLGERAERRSASKNDDSSKREDFDD